MLYRGVHQRHASVKELASINYELLRHGNSEVVVSEMVESEEFAIMRVPNLLAQASVKWCGRHLFFIHIPKTAGTSTRLALIASSGVPAIAAYSRPGEVDASKWRQLKFWPLFIGHRHIDYFPEPHRGLTVLREARSRYLSAYRQRQNNLTQPHILDPKQEEIRLTQAKHAISTPFEQWIMAKRPMTVLEYFASGHASKPRQFIKTATNSEIQRSLVRGFDRIDHAAWAHESAEIVRAISDATGDPAPKLESHNVYKKAVEHRLERIGPSALALLDELRQLDSMVEQAAIARGILRPMSSSEADGIFESTAQRLGFELS